MKLNPTFILPIALLTYSLVVHAEAPEFQEADKDKDGVLSVEEANEALPELEFADDNGDGLVNHAEAEKSIEGLVLPMQGQSEDKTRAPVGMAEYRMIVQVMETRSSDA